MPTLTQKAGVEITSMTPGKKQKIKDIIQKPVIIDGYDIEEMDVSVDMHAPYRAVGEYIRLLKEEFPVFARVVSVSLSKESNASLKANLALSFYLVSKK